jgi:peptidyl-prolyl cis-trans isomerase D
MFQLVQKHKRLLQVVFMLLIIPPFAFFGLEAYTRSFSGRDDVATVEGTPISQREFSTELARQQERMRAVFGRSVDTAALDTPEIRRGLLDSLIAQRVLVSEAARARVLVDDDTLRGAIAGMPAFHVDGKFSRPAYETVLRAQGLTPATFQENLRMQISLSQLSRAVGETAFTARSSLERLAALEEQKREVVEARVAAEPFLAQVRIEPAQVRAYYDSNQADFRVAERVRAQYVVLSAADLAAQASVTEGELKAAYDAGRAQAGGGEQRRASHILIQVAPEAKDAERQAARKKAQEVRGEVARAPARFAELARKHSQDPGSAEKGGDLGFFPRGSMVKAFEDAAFALKEGETSGVVESEFGYHIIRVTAIQGGKAPTFDSMRKQLAAEVQRQKGQRRFAEVAEAFGNMVYEQSDTLEPAAQKYQLQIQTSDWLENTPNEKAGPLDNARLRSALFSSEALQNKRNTDAVEVAAGVLVAARVAGHQPASTRKFEEVQADIEKRLRLREAAKLAKSEGAKRLEALRNGEAASLAWGAAKQVSRRDPQGVSPGALKSIASADTAKLPAYVGVDAGDAGYAIYRITKVIESPPRTEQQRNADLERARMQDGAAQYEAYLGALRGRSKVEVNEARLLEKK